MNADNYADYREAQIQREMMAGPAVINFWRLEYHVDFEEMAGQDLENVEEGLGLIGAAFGVAREILYTIEVERGLLEVYIRTQRWLGPIATMMECEVVAEP